LKAIATHVAVAWRHGQPLLAAGAITAESAEASTTAHGAIAIARGMAHLISVLHRCKRQKDGVQENHTGPRLARTPYARLPNVWCGNSCPFWFFCLAQSVQVYEQTVFCYLHAAWQRCIFSTPRTRAYLGRVLRFLFSEVSRMKKPHME
jgi:hypothetical protein